MRYTVREVGNALEFRQFYQFQNRLYRNCPTYVPSLDYDKRHTLAGRPCDKRVYLERSRVGNAQFHPVGHLGCGARRVGISGKSARNGQYQHRKSQFF